MGNISIKINLTQFQAVVKPMPNKIGEMVDCVILPITKNHFFKGEKGVYVDLIAFERKDKKDGIKDTHSIKQSFPKEFFEGLTQEEKNSMPYIGGLIVWDENPTSSEKPIVTQSADDDGLPF
jgi:hypothetical protein